MIGEALFEINLRLMNAADPRLFMQPEDWPCCNQLMGLFEITDGQIDLVYQRRLE